LKKGGSLFCFSMPRFQSPVFSRRYPIKKTDKTKSAKKLDFERTFVYYGCSMSVQKFPYFSGGVHVIKVNQEKLQEKIKKLKQVAVEKTTKAAGNADPVARKARKQVKRAQRKLRTAKAYKSSGKKAGEATPAASA